MWGFIKDNLGIFFVNLPQKSLYTGVSLTLEVPETKIAEFANSVDLDEVVYK